MKNEIAFCPFCAGKLDAGDDEHWICSECDTHFFIEVVNEDDADDDDDDDEEEEEVEEL